MQRKAARLHQTLRGMKRVSKNKKSRKEAYSGSYREEKEEGKMTLRLFLEKILVSKSYGIYVEGLVFFACLFSTLVYIVTTYTGSTPVWFDITDYFICGMLALEYLLFLYISQQRLSYLLSVDSLIDLYIFGAVFIFNSFDSDISKLFVSCSRLLRVTKISRVLKQWLQIGDNNVNSQIFTIVITIFTIIYFFAGLIQLFENMYMSSDNEPYKFHDMIYFTVVTLSTVGYGDIVPQTTPGQFAVIVLIMMVIVLIPKQSSDLLMLIDLQSPYARAMYKANPEIPHLIVCGNASVLALKTFCSELLHPDHGSQDKNAVILNERVPNADMEAFLHDPQYEVYLTYLQGNPMIDRDLDRASANKSKLCVIFTDKSTRDPVAADHKNILTALAIKQQVYYEIHDSLRVCVQIMKPESQTHYFSTLNIQTAEPRDHLIIVEEIKMNLMAKSCFSPGIIGLVSNLVATSGDLSGFSEVWINEYTQGMNFELYRTEVPNIFKGKTFLEVVKIVYFQLKGIASI
ncbi:MAG: ion channel [Candidatus Pacebacteria bacterium]|nr:ion channel [Candidatus Paceibacterota bacterium]